MVNPRVVILKLGLCRGEVGVLLCVKCWLDVSLKLGRLPEV